jgi:uncharacterized protein YndB with AHSA1/START domain
MATQTATTLPSATCGVIIDRPVAEVFAYVSDVARLPEWVAAIVEARRTSAEPMGRGSTFINVVRALGRRVEVAQEVAEYEAQRRVVLHSESGPLPTTLTQTFEPVGDGTRLTQAVAFAPRHVFKLAGPLVVAGARRHLAGDLATLKRLLEAER